MVFKKKDHPIIIGITGVPKREKLMILAIDSILNQSLVPDKIIISICDEYKRFPGEKYNEKYLLKYKEDKRVIINKCNDYGPFTRLLGIIDYHNKQKKKLNDTLIILMNDDAIYKKWVVEKIHDRFKLNSKRAYSFEVSYNYTNKCDFSRGSGAPALNSNIIKKIKKYYDDCIAFDPRLFYNEDLVFSKYLCDNKFELVKLSNKNSILIYSQIPGATRSIGGLIDDLSTFTLNKIKIPKFTKNQ